MREIGEYYVGEAGEEVAAHIVSRIEEKCRIIAETPGSIGRFRPEVGEDVRSFPVAPHVVFYRLTAETMYVARILHGRQDLRPDLFEE